MIIHIDESGIFANPRGLESCPSVVAALITPTATHDEFLERHRCLKALWGADAGEVKGSTLDESQARETRRPEAQLV